MWGIHRPPVNSPHKGQWRVAFMPSLICAWRNNWVNTRHGGDLTRHRTHYDVTVVVAICRHKSRLGSNSVQAVASLIICVNSSYISYPWEDATYAYFSQTLHLLINYTTCILKTKMQCAKENIFWLTLFLIKSHNCINVYKEDDVCAQPETQAQHTQAQAPNINIKLMFSVYGILQ